MVCSGVGGGVIGWLHAHEDVLACVDRDEYACATLRRNFPEMTVVQADVTTRKGQQQVRKMMNDLKRDGVFGVSITASCAPHSSRTSLGAELSADKIVEHEADADVTAQAISFFGRMFRPWVIDVENVKNFGNKPAAQNAAHNALALGFCVGTTVHSGELYGCPTPRARFSLSAFADDRVCGCDLAPPVTHPRGAPPAGDLVMDAKERYHFNRLFRELKTESINGQRVLQREMGELDPVKYKKPFFTIQSASKPWACVCQGYSNPRCTTAVWKEHKRYWLWTEFFAAVVALGFPSNYVIVDHKKITKGEAPRYERGAPDEEHKRAAKQIAGAMRPPYARAKAAHYRTIAQNLR